MIITQTSHRLSLCGGGSDYKSWYTNHGGIVVGGTLNQHSYVSARFLPPFHTYKTRVVYSDIETVQENREIQHRAIRACLEYLGWDGPEAPGLEIFHAADLPGRSGTGSSSTFVVGLLNAIAALKGRRMLPAELAEAAIHVEQVMMGETVGCQDQTWAAYGGLNVIKFQTNGNINVYPLLLNHGQIEELEWHLLLFFTGISRTSSDVAKTYAAELGTPAKSRDQWAMIRLAEHAVPAIENGQYEKLGQLIDQSWRIKSGLSSAVSNDKISAMYASARVHGAWGGKITGAGGGGSLILVAPPSKHSDIVSRMEELGATHIPFRFSFSGSQVIFAEKGNINEYRPKP